MALARAAITEPRVLLLDEPLSALDEQLRVRMRLELQRMQRDLGITFVHVTHSQLEAIALADMVVVMDRGEIRQAGAARDVYATPRDRYVAEFLGGQNVFAGRVDAINGDLVSFASPQMKHIAVPVGSAPVSTGDTIDVAVRRDDVGLVRPGVDVAADTSWLASRVLAVEYQGNFVKVMLDATGTDEFIAYIPERDFLPRPLRDRRCRPGDLAEPPCASACQNNCLNCVTQTREGMAMVDYEMFELGDVTLQCGQILRGAKMAYKTYGKLNAAKDNVIVYPCWYSGTHLENEWLIGSDMALDPGKYFIIIPNMFGNGLSTSAEQYAGAVQRLALPEYHRL